MKFKALLVVSLTSVLPLGAATITLGTASPFAVLAAGAATNAGNFMSNGEVGAPALSGFPGTVTQTNTVGALFTSGTPLGDFNTAFTAAQTATPTFTGSSLPSTLTPGVYDVSSGVLPSSLTFNGAGQYIIQIPGAFADNAATFNLTNGATANNIFFEVGGAGTISSNSTFDGNLLVAGSVSILGPGTIDGRVMTKGAISIFSQSGTESVQVPGPASATPEPGTFGLLSLALLGGVAAVRRRARS